LALPWCQIKPVHAHNGMGVTLLTPIRGYVPLRTSPLRFPLDPSLLPYNDERE
jgi:hypothetical protein